MAIRENNDKIPFTHTFHPHSNLKNFKLLQYDPDTGGIGRLDNKKFL